MPYYPNFQPQYSNQEEQMLFHQFKMQMQMNKQQQSNQFTTSQPHFEQQSHHLVDETEEEEEEPLPTPTSKPNRGRKKSVAKRNKGKDVEVEKETKEGRIRHAWTQAEELLLTESTKWKNPESTLQRRSRLRGTDKEPDHFGDDELPRPPGLQRIAKNRKAKMQVLSQESEDRRRLIQSQKIAEDMKVLQIDTSGMYLTYAAIINAQKERIRAEYLPPN
ncbi:hypothetical protein Tco_0807754 [Tanacetum coccineum]